MNGMSTGPLQPTWFGYVKTTRCALVLIEACQTGTLHYVPRRPHAREQAQLIRSGCVFIYEGNGTGIKRWTDGLPWSPSRFLGNFLVYRELTKPFPPGEKRLATKKKKRSSKPSYPYPKAGGSDAPNSPMTPGDKPEGRAESRKTECALIGSLVDSYEFKEGGLVKKSMSVKVCGMHYYLVSYYRIEDVLNGILQPPSADSLLTNIEPRHTLISQTFREPLDEGIFSEQMNISQQEPYFYCSDDRSNIRIPDMPSQAQQPEMLYLGFLPDANCYQGHINTQKPPDRSYSVDFGSYKPSGIHMPTPLQPIMAPAYTDNNSQWVKAPSSGPTLPPPDGMWYTADGGSIGSFTACLSIDPTVIYRALTGDGAVRNPRLASNSCSLDDQCTRYKLPPTTQFSRHVSELDRI